MLIKALRRIKVGLKQRGRVQTTPVKPVINTDSLSSDIEMLPKISIITPSYNQGQFLEICIQSVLNQKYPKLEYIIIDGASTDESVDIIKKYAGNLAYWISAPDEGQSDAINKGFAHSTGDVIAWLNSDDFYLDGAFEAIAKAYQENPAASF